MLKSASGFILRDILGLGGLLVLGAWMALASSGCDPCQKCQSEVVPTGTPTITATPAPTPIATATPAATVSPTGSPVIPTLTPTPAATPSPTSSAGPTLVPTATPTCPTTLTVSGQVIVGSISSGNVTPNSPVTGVAGAPVWLEALGLPTTTPTPFPTSVGPTPTFTFIPTPTPTPTPIGPTPTPSPTPVPYSIPLYLISTTVTNSSGQFTFTNVPASNVPLNTFILVTDSGALPLTGSPSSNATVTGPLNACTSGGTISGLLIPVVSATNSNSNSLVGLVATMNIAASGNDVTYMPAQPIDVSIFSSGGISPTSSFGVDALVPPFTFPGGTKNGIGGPPYLPTSTSATNCSSVLPGTTCAVGSNCACFSLGVPNGNPIVGNASTAGTGYTQPTPPENCLASPAACYATYFSAATLGTLSGSATGETLPAGLYGTPDCPSGFPTIQPFESLPTQLNEMSLTTSVPGYSFSGCQ